MLAHLPSLGSSSFSLRDITASDLGGGGEAVRYAARERGSAFYCVCVYIYVCECVCERESVCAGYT